MAEAQQSNRRAYYRVQDQVGLEFRLIEQGQDLTGLFEDQVSLGLHQELGRIDQEVHQQLVALADKDRNLAFLLKSLNHKLDTIARIMAFEQKPLQQAQWHRVILSEGGLAFSADHEDNSGQSLEPGNCLALRLTLLPELQRILLRGKVVKLTGNAGKRRIHIAFTELFGYERQAIARHVLRVQARERRAEAHSVQETMSIR